MARFNLKDRTAGATESASDGIDLAERLKHFPSGSESRPLVSLADVDAAGAPHGFISREAGPAAYASLPAALPTPISSSQDSFPRKRRKIATEPTRDLSFCMGFSEYDRFVAFADRYKLTYRQAVVRLLDLAAGHRA